jgi:hypothetical protein
MSTCSYVVVLIILGIVSGHITHIMVSGVIFRGLRQRIKDLGETKGGKWAFFGEGFLCQLCAGVWYSSIIALWLTIAIYVLKPSLWVNIAEHPLGRLEPVAWLSLFIVQAFFIAAVGHLFREFVGLVEDQRTHQEGETNMLEYTIRRMSSDEPSDN